MSGLLFCSFLDVVFKSLKGCWLTTLRTLQLVMELTLWWGGVGERRSSAQPASNFTAATTSPSAVYSCDVETLRRTVVAGAGGKREAAPYRGLSLRQSRSLAVFLR